MVGHRFVEIFEVDLAAVRDFRVVVLEAEDPFARRRLGRARAKRVLDGGDAPEITVDVHELGNAAPCGMRVRVDEARRDRHSLGVDTLGASSGEVRDVVARAHGHEPAVLDGERFRARHVVVDRENARVRDDEIGRSVGRNVLGRGARGRSRRESERAELQELRTSELRHDCLLTRRHYARYTPSPCAWVSSSTAAWSKSLAAISTTRSSLTTFGPRGTTSRSSRFLTGATCGTSRRIFLSDCAAG